jgi:hypothetical protein
MRKEVTEMFRKLREFQTQSSQRFADFHVQLGLPLMQETTESSAIFESAIEAVADLALRDMAGDLFREPFVECEIVETADDSTWLYEDRGSINGLEGFSWSRKEALGDKTYKYHGFYDLTNMIPRTFEYVSIELRDAAVLATRVFVHVPFEHVRFYLSIHG